MKKVKFLIRVNFVLLILLSNGFSQSIQFEITGGYSNIQKPKIYTKKISDYGLGLNKGYFLGGKIKVSFSDFPIKITGLANYFKAEGCGTPQFLDW